MRVIARGGRIQAALDYLLTLRKSAGRECFPTCTVPSSRELTSRIDCRSQGWKLFLVSFLLLASVLSPSPVEGAGLAPSQVVRLWIRFYGQQDTLPAAGFTTAGFRKGEPPAVWAAKAHAVLHCVDYQHLGGEIMSATLSETTATIILAATIHTRRGTTTQTETYHLRRQDGRWLIDQLEITDQVRQEPGVENTFLEV